jgi:SAM-dependent methyltransferase
VDYQGSELEIFAGAERWKDYWASRILPFVSGSVLDVGAGIGSNIAPLYSAPVRSWCALEPDAELASRIDIETGFPLEVRTGTLDTVTGTFDTILYLDVLEHIEDDLAELTRAAEHLAPGGNLIVLAPAHQYLFSAFDQAIGHHRRYNLETLAAIAPAGLQQVRAEYLDSLGMLASMANRFLLHESSPGQRQIEFWDRILVPLSRLIDRVLLGRLGKSVIMIWQKPG